MSTISGGHPERLVPDEASGSLLEEHVARYRYASKFVTGKVVLDVACGTGYGTSMLKTAGASSVIGIDLSAPAIEYARSRWQKDGIAFRVDDAQKLESVADRSIDCVASFETLEHLPDARAFVKQLSRVMKPGAVLFVSTPNRRVGRLREQWTRKPANPFHVYEFTRRELIDLFTEDFQVDEILGQCLINPILAVLPIQLTLKLMFIAFNAKKLRERIYYKASGTEVQPTVSYSQPRFLIARCTRRAS